MRAVTYLRVSTREQSEEGYSLAAQRGALARYLDDHGWEHAREFCDAGESARSADRPQYQAMLEYFAEHDDIDVLVVHKLDRLARNLEDHAALRAGLRKWSVQLVSLTENLENSPSGQLIEGILAALNEFYSANLAQEIRKGQLQKLKEGGWPGRAPIGYRNVRPDGGHGQSVLLIDEDRGWLIRQAFELYATGNWPLYALQVELERRGLRTATGRPLSRSMLAVVLRNRAYIGRMCWNGIDYAGNHVPIVSDELFDRVQAILDAKSVAGERQRRHTHPLKGILACHACGSRLTLAIAKEGRFAYFFCLGTQRRTRRCTQPYAPLADIEAALADSYQQLHLPQPVLDKLQAELKHAVASQIADCERSVGGLRRRLTRLEHDRDRLMRAYYAEAIAPARLRAEQQRLDTEQTHARTMLADNQHQLERIDQLVDTALAQARDLRATYEQASPTVQRMLNQAVFAGITVRDARVKTVTLQPLFETTAAPTR